ncbi:MAG TPA: hypothetical protein VHN12_07330 [Geobacteraceae bacterium]|nr:hypothetical protein [Geobacteraceae bacterium]
MGKIPTDNLIPGMILASDVRDRSGRLLLTGGTALNDRHLYILRTWGIIEAEVAGAEEYPESPELANAIAPEVWSAIEDEITPLFRHADLAHPAMKELLRMRIMKKARHGNR